MKLHSYSPSERTFGVLTNTVCNKLQILHHFSRWGLVGFKKVTGSTYDAHRSMSSCQKKVLPLSQSHDRGI